MRHENSSHIVSAGNRYKFSGKEVETTGNLSTLDFGWRQYDPQIGRWSVYDPYSELYSSETPYAYVGNNPVNFYDPNGKEKKKDKDQDPDEIVIDNEKRITQLMKYLKDHQDASINDIFSQAEDGNRNFGNLITWVGIMIDATRQVVQIPKVGYNIAYNSFWVNSVNYSKPIGYGATIISGASAFYKSFNGKQSWTETIINTNITALALKAGGWYGIAIQLDYMEAKAYMKAITEHPEYSIGIKHCR
jgi:RHS repeat-associated protein